MRVAWPHPAIPIKVILVILGDDALDFCLVEDKKAVGRCLICDKNEYVDQVACEYQLLAYKLAVTRLLDEQKPVRVELNALARREYARLCLGPSLLPRVSAGGLRMLAPECRPDARKGHALIPASPGCLPGQPSSGGHPIGRRDSRLK